VAVREHPRIYHDARQALARVRALDLADHQVYVPGGMFFGWVVENRLEGAGVPAELADEFRARTLTGPRLFSRLGGVLDGRHLGEHARAFAADYLGEGDGDYFRDFEEWFPVPTMFHVHDTWDDYEWMRIRLVARYADWRSALG
jgi:hypothetical protein